MSRMSIEHGSTGRLGLAADSVDVEGAHSSMTTASLKIQSRRRQRYVYGLGGDHLGHADEGRTTRQKELARIAGALRTLKENVESLLLDERFSKTGRCTTSNDIGSRDDKALRNGKGGKSTMPEEAIGLATAIQEYDSSKLKLNVSRMNDEALKLLHLVEKSISDSEVDRTHQQQRLREQQAPSSFASAATPSKIDAPFPNDEDLGREREALLEANAALASCAQASDAALHSSEYLHQQSLRALETSIANEQRMSDQFDQLCEEVALLGKRATKDAAIIAKLERQKSCYIRMLSADSNSVFRRHFAVVFGHWRGSTITARRHNAVIELWLAGRRARAIRGHLETGMHAFRLNLRQSQEKLVFLKKLSRRLRQRHLLNYFHRWDRVTSARHQRNVIAKRMAARWIFNLYLSAFETWKDLHTRVAKERAVHSIIIERELQHRRRTLMRRCFWAMWECTRTSGKPATLERYFTAWVNAVESGRLKIGMLSICLRHISSSVDASLAHTCLAAWYAISSRKTHANRVVVSFQSVSSGRRLRASFVAWHRAVEDITAVRARSTLATWRTRTRKFRRERVLAEMVVRRMRSRSLSASLQQWQYAVKNATRHRCLLHRFFARATKQQLGRAFTNWQDNSRDIARRRSTLERAVYKMQHRALSSSFESWHAHIVERKRIDVVVSGSLLRMRSTILAMSFDTWFDNAKSQQRHRYTLHKVIVRIRTRELAEAFSSWMAIVAHLRHQETVVRRFVTRWTHIAMASAFASWYDAFAIRAEKKRAMRRAVRALRRSKLARIMKLWQGATYRGHEVIWESRAARLAELAVRGKTLHKSMRVCFQAWATRCRYKKAALSMSARLAGRMLHAYFSAWLMYVSVKAHLRRSLARFGPQRRRLVKTIAAWAAHTSSARIQRSKVLRFVWRWLAFTKEKSFTLWRVAAGQIRPSTYVSSKLKHARVYDSLSGAWKKWRFVVKLARIRQFLSRTPQRFNIGTLARCLYKWEFAVACRVFETGMAIVREKVASIDTDLLRIECMENRGAPPPVSVLSSTGAGDVVDAKDRADEGAMFASIKETRALVQAAIDVLSSNQSLFRRVRTFRGALKALTKDFAEIGDEQRAQAEEAMEARINELDTGDDLEMISKLFAAKESLTVSPLLMDAKGDAQLFRSVLADGSSLAARTTAHKRRPNIGGPLLRTAPPAARRGGGGGGGQAGTPEGWYSVMDSSPAKVLSEYDAVAKVLSYDFDGWSPVLTHPHGSRSVSPSVEYGRRRNKLSPHENWQEHRWIP